MNDDLLEYLLFTDSLNEFLNPDSEEDNNDDFDEEENNYYQGRR